LLREIFSICKSFLVKYILGNESGQGDRCIAAADQEAMALAREEQSPRSLSGGGKKLGESDSVPPDWFLKYLEAAKQKVEEN